MLQNEKNFVVVCPLQLMLGNVIVAELGSPYVVGQKMSVCCCTQIAVVYIVSVHLEEHLMTPGWSLFDLQDLKFFHPLYLVDY